MCTAVTFLEKDFYFGRTLDLERTYGEEVVISPRNFPFPFLQLPTMSHHYAMIGMAHVSGGYPLYYDGVNEAGLCMAGLNFPEFARYHETAEDRDNVASFEFIPWVLGQCKSSADVYKLLQRLQLTGDSFHPDLPATPLHWIIADKTACITVEAVAEGIRIHENPAGVLTNSPPFDDQMFFLRNYMHLSPDQPQNHFSPKLDLKPCSRGMGAIGLPGDLSSQSRFVRAAFTKLNAICTEGEGISQFFHIMDTVSQTKGCCRLPDGRCEFTRYTSCCNATRGTYCYTTYGNRRISMVDMRKENLDGAQLIRFPLMTGEDIYFLNGEPKEHDSFVRGSESGDHAYPDIG